MTRRFSTPILVAALCFTAFACSDRPAGPIAPLASAAPQGGVASLYDRDELPGQHRPEQTSNTNARFVRCDAHGAFDGSADIGPRGGTVRIGPHLLVVPPGAVTTTVHISGVAPSGEYVRVHFEPSGLVFKKPAGLILDTQGCDIPSWYPPDVVYVKQGVIVERIDAVYSNYWHTAAAPIGHFSSYFLAW